MVHFVFVINRSNFKERIFENVCVKYFLIEETFFENFQLYEGLFYR